MSDGIIGSVGVAVVPDAEAFWRRFQAQTRGGAAEAGRRAGDDWSRGFQGSAGRQDVVVRANTKQAQKDTLSLLGSLLALAPAVVPLAAAAGLGGAALVEMGAAGALALKGIQADIKAANADGVAFAAGVGVLRNDLHGLEQTSAHNVLGEFQQVTAKLHADMPSVNNDLAQSAKVLGDIGGHVVGGLIGGLHNFGPALLQIEQGVDGVAAKFEAWATGPGGAKFSAALIEDFQHVEPLLENLSVLIAHVIAAGNAPGLGIVDELTVFSKVLAEIPTPVLSALTTGIAALKIAGLVSGLMSKLAVSITAEAAAAGGAAAANSGLRGRLASTVSVLGEGAAAWIAVSVAADAAKSATTGWQSSSDDVKRFFGTFTTGLSDIGHFNFTGLWSDLFGAGADKAAKAAGYVKTLHSALDDMYESFGKRQQSTIIDLQHSKIGSIGSAAGDKTSPTVEEQIQKSYKVTLDATTEAMGRQQQALATLASHSTVSQLQTSYGDAASALQKNIDTGEKFLKVGGEQAYVYKGVSVTSGMYAIALQKTGGNLEAATGFIHAQIDALGREKTVLAGTTTAQQRLGTFVSDLTTKYKISGSQVDVYTEALGLNIAAIAASPAAMQAAEREFGVFISALRNGSTAVGDWIAAVDQWTKSADTAADRAALIGEALRAANGDALGYANTMVQAATANQQMVTDFHNLKSGVLNLKTGVIDFHNAAAAPLLGDLQNLQTAAMNAAAATYQHYNAIGDAAAADKAFNVYVNDTQGALEGQASQLGITKGEAKKLATEYFGIKNSGDLKKQIELIGQDKVLTALKGILEDLDILAGKHVTTYVDTVYRTRGQGTKISDPRLRAADGMIVTAGTGPRADDVLVRVSKGEAIIPADQTAKHMGMVKALISRTQGFRAGGVVGDPSNPFTGVDYSGNANKNGVVSKHGTKGKGPTYTVAGKQYSSLQSAENAARTIFKADVALGVTIDDKDLTSFRAALKGTVAQAQAAAQKIDADLAKLGASKTLRINLRNANADLDKVIGDRNAKADQLKTVRQEFGQVHDSVQQAGQGGFDVTTAGTGFNGQQPVTFGSMQAQQTQAKAKIDAWAAGIRKLGGVFGKSGAGKEYLQELAQGGPNDYPEVAALLSASPKNLANFAATQSHIDATSSALGNYVGNQLYGSQITKLQGQIKLDDGTIDRMATHIEKAVEKAVKQLADRPIEVKVGDKVIARAAASGTKKVSR